MIFAEDMLELVLAGTKTQTRRPTRVQGTGRTLIVKPCRYVVGRSYALQPGRGLPSVGRIRILRVSCEVVLSINTADARAEGFSSVAAFFDRWRSLHKDVPGWCWRIEFALEGRNDVTVPAAAPVVIQNAEPWT